MSLPRFKILHPLESRGIAVAELPVSLSDGPEAFHVMAIAPSLAELSVNYSRGEFTIGFGQYWHTHIPYQDTGRVVQLIESLVSGESVVVESFNLKGKYTASGPVLALEVPGRRHGDRFVIESWRSPANRANQPGTTVDS